MIHTRGNESSTTQFDRKASVKDSIVCSNDYATHHAIAEGTIYCLEFFGTKKCFDDE